MRFPVFWLALAYAAGLASFYEVDDSPRLLFLLAAAALLVSLTALWRRWLHTTLACALAGFFFAGGAAITGQEAAVPPTRADRLVATRAQEIDLSEAVRLVGWLRRAPGETPTARVYELELEILEQRGRVYKTSGGARLSFFKAGEPGLPPETVPDWRYGDRLEVLVRVHPPINHLNPGSFDWRAYLARGGLFLEGSLKSYGLVQKLPGRRGNRFYGWTQALRTRLLQQLEELVPPAMQPDRHGALRAMLLGDAGFLSPGEKERFRLSGTYHVLVVSGLNVAIIAFVIYWALYGLIRSKWVTTLVTLPVLVIYLLLVEDRPPIERAVWMVSLYLLAQLLYRQVHLANPMALAALAVLFLHPLWLFEPSFQLSFGAVFLIAFFCVPWVERTSKPYREALGFLDAEERDEQLRPPHLAQFRLDLRQLAAALAGAMVWTDDKERAARRLLTALVRTGLRAWEFFLLSFAIQLGFVLLSAWYFNRVAWVGLLANVLAVPLVSWIVPLGLAALLVGLAWTAAGALLAQATGLLTALLLWIVDTLGTRGLSYGVPPPPLWLLVLYLAGLALLGVAVARERLQRWAAVLLAALILVVVTFPFAPRVEQAALEVTALDVGQGDALLVTFPNREVWLVDAGRGPVETRPGSFSGEAVGETVVVPYLRARGLKRLDRVWLSHAHLDHMGGLPAVLEEFPVGDFNVGRNPQSAAYRRLLGEVGRHGVRLETHAAGERFRVGEVTAEVLWPAVDYQPGREPSNNDSLVLRLCLPAAEGLPGREPACVLLPGDIEGKIEKKLAEANAPLAATVLKVPHHGGRDAATAEFLAAVRPEAAVISVGAENPFGHPFADVVARLEAETEELYRSDRDGSVTLRLTASGLDVWTYRSQQPRRPYPNLFARLAACARRLLSLEWR